MILRASSFVIAVVACGGAPRVATTTTATCETAAANYAEVAQGIVRDTDRPKTRAAFEQIALRRCKAERWSATTIACVASSEDPIACTEQLPEDHVMALDGELAAWRTQNVDQWDLDSPLQLGRPHVDGPHDPTAMVVWMHQTWFPAVTPCFQDKPSQVWTVMFSIQADGTFDEILVAEDAESSHGVYLCVVEKMRGLRVESSVAGVSDVRVAVLTQTPFPG